MTFLEAALEVLRREGKPLHYKDLAERAIGKKLLTFVGRTPEVTMQTQLTAAVKKAPGSPFVRVKPGVFGLLRYPELPPEPPIEKVEPKAEARSESKSESRSRPARDDAAAGTATATAESAAERGRRRRRRGGRGRTRAEGAAGFAPNGHKGKDDTDGVSAAEEAGAEGSAADHADHDGPEDHEPRAGNLSAEARAAALAETGVLEGDDDGDEDADAGDHEDQPVSARASASPAGAPVGDDATDAGDDELGDDDEPEGALEAGAAGAADAPPEGDDADRTGRRRRRRRRRRHGEEGAGAGTGAGATPGAPAASTGFGPPSRASGSSASSGSALGERGDADGDALSGDSGDGDGESEGGEAAGSETRASGGGSSDETRERSSGDAGAESGDNAQGARRIMTPVDAAIEILRGQAPGRGVHVRQIADAAARRRLVHGEPNEAWRVMRTALAAEPRERLRAGQRPRVRSAGSGLFALARRPPDGELERAEQVFGEARRALRERTVAALERRIGELPAPAFEALARVLLQREGFGPATFVKRVEGTIYVEALRGRGSRPSKCLVGLRPGASSAGRRAIGELRAGIRARSQDEGVLLLGGRLAEDAIAEWKQAGPPVEIADGQAVAETCIRHGVGVINTMVSVDFVDADFFAELAEG
jgi:hypothetical protein